MKHLRLLTVLLCSSLIASAVPGVVMADGDEAEGVEICSENFPDDTFRVYVQEFDTDESGYLTPDEIAEVTRINLTSKGVTDLTGIKYFTSLESLNATGNSLTSLDMSDMTTVQLVMVSNNQLTDIDVSGMENLKMLSVGYNHLTTLYAVNLPELLILECSHNDLTELYVSSSHNIHQISCACNNLTGLDPHGCPDLESIWCYGNNITALDLRDNLTLAQNYVECEVEHEVVDGYNIVKYWKTTEQENVNYYCLMVDEGVQLYIPEGITAPPVTVTPTPYSGPDEPGVSGFVERLYSVALNRASDPEGKANWVEAISSGEITGADAARGFLYSNEFLRKPLDTRDFVTVLYRTFFDRDPDQAGLAAWVNALEGGSSKQDVIEGFINSTEWANLCLNYGIDGGGTGTPSVEVEPNQATIDFATRLYTTCLCRAADQNGLMAWARQLANQRDTGTGAARGFFFSSEFTNQNVSNAEYVNRLYRTFMGREADEAGFNAWVAQLDAGTSREEVFNGFAQSNEFGVICAQYGIIKGS